MPRSDAQKRAEAKYRKEKTHRLAIDYTHAEYADVLEAAQRVEMPIGTFARLAIKEKMAKSFPMNPPEIGDTGDAV